MIAPRRPSCLVEPQRCCVCGSQESERVASGRDFEYGTTDDLFNVVRCTVCGLNYLNPRPSVGEMSTIYPPHYYAYHYAEKIHPLARTAKEFLDRRKITGWLAHLKTRRPRFLDVGCGDGRYLEALHRRGVPREDLWGVELDARAVNRLVEKGFNGRHGRIEEIDDLPSGSFDLIVMLQVLEHVSDPDACIRRLAALLSPDGVLVLETPSVHSLDRTLFKRRYWGGYHFPRHWNLFDARTLNALLNKNGLERLSVRYLPSPVFWIYSLQHLTRHALRLGVLARFFDPLRNVPMLALFTAFDMVRASLGFRTSNMQMIARRR